MLKFKYLILTILLTLLSACSKTNDFNTLCGYFDLLDNEENLQSMSAIDKYNFINKHTISNLSNDSDARASWEAIVNFTPASGRYDMFLIAADSSLNKAWECKSMQKHLKDMPDY